MTEVSDDGVNRVRALTQEGELIHFAGKKTNSRQSCPVETCRDIGAQNCTCAVPNLPGLMPQQNEFEV